jgi:hypothetical protein
MISERHLSEARTMKSYKYFVLERAGEVLMVVLGNPSTAVVAGTCSRNEPLLSKSLATPASARSFSTLPGCNTSIHSCSMLCVRCGNACANETRRWPFVICRKLAVKSSERPGLTLLGICTPRDGAPLRHLDRRRMRSAWNEVEIG